VDSTPASRKRATAQSTARSHAFEPVGRPPMASQSSRKSSRSGVGPRSRAARSCATWAAEPAASGGWDGVDSAPGESNATPQTKTRVKNLLRGTLSRIIVRLAYPRTRCRFHLDFFQSGAEGTVECGSSSYRLPLGLHTCSQQLPLRKLW